VTGVLGCLPCCCLLTCPPACMPADVFLSLQAIMRQPALLLHDGTINPSTYDKESIAQWLAEHRCVYVEDGGRGGGLTV
jgi:hypothetical protein